MSESAWPDLSGQTILQVIPDLSAGGAERTTVEMAEAITGAGGRALVASAGGRLEDALKVAGGELIQMNAASKNPLTIRKNTRLIEAIVADEKVSLIHARSRAPAWSAYVAAKRTETPFVTTYHGAYSGRSGLKKRYNSVMARGDLVIANSKWTAAHVMEIHETPADKIITIPRGVDFAAFDPENVSEERVQTLKLDWQIEAGDARLIFVLPGRLTSWKGQSLAIDALGALDAAERDRIHLVLAGDDQGRKGYVTELEDKIIHHKLGGTVSIVGHTTDMPAAYLAADVVVAPSTRPEAFGRVAAEASAMAKPVIVADHGGQRETVIEGETGTRAEPGSVPALTACIRTLANLRPEARDAMGRAGQAYVREHFSKKQLQTATINVYARLLQNTASVEN
ncbi:MAG: glycosyltransferase family 4 protein [Henriciella sp.]|nr:glycosyltransferase family 4 protein [Henriciella sp.]